ncbi:hypothetical protein ABZP36_027269 [Zizania latifolia]
MRSPSQMLPLRVIVILASMLAAPSLGVATGDKCKCLMCICDVDPHPHPPPLPSHRRHPPPPEEPEYYHPPPSSEPKTTPVYYYPPPPYEEYPSSQGTYWPPTPVVGIVGTTGQMYPRDSAFIPSSSHRRRCHGSSLSLILAASLVSGVLSLLALSI